MYLPWRYAQEQAAELASTKNGDLCTPSITAARAETFDLQMAEYLKKKVYMSGFKSLLVLNL